MKIVNEDINKPVITSRQVMIKGELIKYVYYDEDGDWQFFHDITIKEKDAFIVSITQIINHDKTLRNLPDLEKGQNAYRNKIDELWIKR